MQIPFAIKDDKVVDVSEVESGLGCGCICPQCESPLVAKKGMVKQHHFAHWQTGRGEYECVGSAESALHLMAKRIIVESKKLYVPEVQSKIRVLWAGRWVHADYCIEEKRIGGIIADVFCQHKGTEYLIEVVVTNSVSEQKRKRIELLNVNVISVYLSDLPANYFSLSVLTKALEDTNRWHWEFPAFKIEEIKKDKVIYQKRQEEKERQRQEAI